MNGVILPFFLSLGLLANVLATQAPDEIEPSDVEIEQAIDKLTIPSGWRFHINQPFHETLMYLPGDMYDDCPDEIDLLGKMPQDIDGQLLKLAWTTPKLSGRYRAVKVLIERKNAAAVPLLQKMAASKDPGERYLAWHAYYGALADKKLPRPADCALAIKAFQQEKNTEVRSNIVYFLGEAKPKEAIPVLISALEADPNETDVSFALARIGDPAAGPVIIKALSKPNLNRHCHLGALGKLATPKAVDFLIQQLGEDGDYAVEALFETKSQKTLPALQKHLKQLQTKKLETDKTRIAIIRLSKPDPRNDLLQIAENVEESEWVRLTALSALESYDVKSFAQRILTLYKQRGQNEFVRMRCIFLLADQQTQGITEAMIAHALEKEVFIATEYHLRWALNKRLKKSFRNFTQMQDYLRKIQATAQAPKSK